MKYAFHPEALTEYAEAVQYYAEQRAEVAQAFIDAVEDAVYCIGNLLLATLLLRKMLGDV